MAVLCVVWCDTVSFVEAQRMSWLGYVKTIWDVQKGVEGWIFFPEEGRDSHIQDGWTGRAEENTGWRRVVKVCRAG